MRARLLTSLNEDELNAFYGSQLYVDVLAQQHELTQTIINYKKEYFSTVGYADDLTLIVYEGETPLMALYAFSKPGTVSWFDLPVKLYHIAFENPNDEVTAYLTLTARLKEVMRQKNYNEIYFYENKYFLGEYLSKVSTTAKHIEAFVDLAPDAEILRGSIRRSYKSLVNWGEKSLVTEIMDAANTDYDKFLQFKEFHFKVSGRRTRSDESWDLQYEAIKAGEGYLISSTYEGNMAAISFVTHGKGVAYYSVGVYDRELMAQDKGLAHFNLLSSILYAKNKGLAEFSMGFLDWDNTDEKERNIFYFKTGFTNSVRINNTFKAKV